MEKIKTTASAKKTAGKAKKFRLPWGYERRYLQKPDLEDLYGMYSIPDRYLDIPFLDITDEYLEKHEKDPKIAGRVQAAINDFDLWFFWSNSAFFEVWVPCMKDDAFRRACVKVVEEDIGDAIDVPWRAKDRANLERFETDWIHERCMEGGSWPIPNIELIQNCLDAIEAIKGKRARARKRA